MPNNRKEFRVDDAEARMIDDLTNWLGTEAYSVWFRQTIVFLHRRASEFREKYPNVPMGITVDDEQTWAFMRAYYDAKSMAQMEISREASRWLRDYQEAQRISGESFQAGQLRVEESILLAARKMWKAGQPVDQTWLSASPVVVVHPAPPPVRTIPADPAEDDGPPIPVVEEVPAPIADIGDAAEPETAYDMAQRLAAMEAARAAPSAGLFKWRIVAAVVVLGLLVVIAGAVGMWVLSNLGWFILE